MANRTRLVNNKDAIISSTVPTHRAGHSRRRRAEAEDVNADENGCQAPVPVQKLRRVSRSLLQQTRTAEQTAQQTPLKAKELPIVGLLTVSTFFPRLRAPFIFSLSAISAECTYLAGHN